jgi:hypothetical protein
MFLVRAYIPGLIDGRLCRTFTERGALKEKFSSKPVSGPLATLSIVFYCGNSYITVNEYNIYGTRNVIRML